MKLQEKKNRRGQQCRRNQLRKYQRGSALVEISLVLVVAFVTMIGIADLGQMLFMRETVQERVRAALRYGALTYDATAIRNVVLYGTPTPAANAQPGYGLTASMIEVTRQDANSSADRVQIRVSNYPIAFYTPFLARTITGPPIVAVQAMEVAPQP